MLPVSGTNFLTMFVSVNLNNFPETPWNILFLIVILLHLLATHSLSTSDSIFDFFYFWHFINSFTYLLTTF